ncbi:MAG TPA: ThuA domain-containing protein [Planctomycetes bacterium]|nr:ThuA domain-containing protein [Planctomycetota bacterium]
MSQRLKFIYIALSGICCLSLLTNCSGAVSPQDVQRIEAAMPAKAVAAPKRPRRLLVFNLCKGFKHGSIPYWDKALEIMGRKTGAFETVVSSDMVQFSAENLKRFDAVCFNNTTRLKFNEPLRKSMMNFIKGGKGIIGIHAATDNFYKWPEAAEMMGGQFCGHPWGSGGTWAVKIDDPGHPLMAPYKGKGFKVNDEIYRTKPPLYSRAKQRVLMSLDMADEATGKKAGPDDTDIGISWVKSYGKGRLFYCSLGHNNHLTWDPALLEHYLAGIQFALGDFPVDTKPKPLISLGKGSEMDELFEKISKYDYGQSRATLTEVSNMVRDAHGSQQKLKQIESSLIGVLNSADSTPAAKQFVCRKLSIIGSEACVRPLAAMLTRKPASKQEPHPADMARYALERIPGEAASAALRKALPNTTGKVKVGIINSLGQRRDSKVVGALSKLIGSSDALIADAAAAALGNIAGPDATKALAEARNKTKGKLRLVVLDSYLKCADKLAAEGKRREASAIYRQLSTEPAPIGAAALRGLVTVRGRRRR